MNVKITYTKDDLKRLILEDLQNKLEGVTFDKTKVHIETKSLQNYKSEWENADFRATYETNE